MWWRWKRRAKRASEASPQARPWLDPNELRDGVATLRPHIRTGFTRVRAALLETPTAFTTLVFHVEFVDAFEKPGIEVWFAGEPSVCKDHPLLGEPLIADGPSLLPADRAFPIGRRDLCGVDTTAEAATVVDAVSLVLRETWLEEPCSALAHVRVFAGWLDFYESLDDPIRGELLEFATGAKRMVELD